MFKKSNSFLLKVITMLFLFTALFLINSNVSYSANSTTTVTLTAGEWTEVGDSGENVVITPLSPRVIVLVQFSGTKPLDTNFDGHNFNNNRETQNALLGSVNTNKIWCRTYLTADITLVVTIL